MDFNCDFDAPMFVDFQNLDGDHQEQEQAEAYFEVDHETSILAENAQSAQPTEASTFNQVECDTAVNQEKNSDPQIPINGGQGMEDAANENCPTVSNSQVSPIEMCMVYDTAFDMRYRIIQ